MSDDTLYLLLQIVLIAFGVGGGGGAIFLGGKKIGQKELSAQNEQLAGHYEKRYNEANEARLKQAERIAELETKTEKQTSTLTDIKARLTILNDERELERKRYQAERDEVMMERGRISAQVEILQREIEQMRADLKDLRAKNDELRKANDKLETYREIAQQQKRDLDEAQGKVRQYESDNQRLKDQIKFLESQLNPEPPPASELPKVSGM